MDMKAKQFMDFAQNSLRHFYTINEPWSLWIENCKITTDLSNTIYDVVHAPAARIYWASKHQVDEEVIKDVNWSSAIEKAASSSPMKKRVFIMKHSVGMCGVGKFMTRLP
jgi:hypothetical protein